MWPFSFRKVKAESDGEEDALKRTRASLVRRLDLFLMTYVCISYCMKYIDQQAHSNAYVSGMKEDLAFKGNEYNWVGTCFSIGYTIGTIPSQFLTAKFRPSVIIPMFEIIWSVLIMVNAAAKNVKLIFAMRFLIGLFESIAYPGFVSVLASWYTPKELAKRVAFLQASSAAGSMFSGYLQAGIYKSLDGRYGLAGWKWLFIIDGIISLPIAITGFFVIPDHPSTLRTFWLKPHHLEQAVERMDEIGRAPKGKLTWQKVVAIFKEYPVWIILLCYPPCIVAGQAISYFNLYLKSKPMGHVFSVYQINLIPTGGQALQIVATIGAAALSDFFKARLSMIVITAGIGMLGHILLSVWDIGFSGQFAGYMLIYCAVGAGALCLTWFSEICSADAEVRTIIIGLANGIGYAWIAGFPFLMYPASQAPHYRYGYKIGAGFYAITITGCTVLAILVKRYGTPYQNVPKSVVKDVDQGSEGEVGGNSQDKEKELDFERTEAVARLSHENERN
ncbi:hypothetical protein I350_05266 [Cryptococcus amylolentus CBS 6273]|uniref:Major facilitator superfamily (MFS) profile domain-containing protein n=1 Tax=Cryptococcus amylolentus CBS 6273 TaxID=1296118 RepID=A0A1E3JWX5_9TREE|nr:hypothetical protein I350_05266 [Cryptococcus amylolentus CBS 6273]